MIRLLCQRPELLRALPVAVLLAVGLLARSSAPAAAQMPEGGTVRAQHGDWQVVCKPPPPGAKSEVCALVQDVTAEDHNNIGLSVHFQKYSDGTRTLRVYAPTGVLLTKMLGLSVDDKHLGDVPFFRCMPFACVAQINVDEKLMKTLGSGKNALFVIYRTEEAGIGIPISLKGFGEGVAALR
ncbi:MAG: invasion associated locus B family protein [Hyphomicrobiaceae bacterium]|jgi:invasion protein IalB